MRRTTIRTATRPALVFADADGNVLEAPEFGAAMRCGADLVPIDPADLVPLPEGSTLYALPGRTAVAITSRGLEPIAGHGAVAAFPPSGWSIFGLAAYAKAPGAPMLPLYAYAAVCWWKGRLCIPAARVERDPKHDPAQFDEGALPAAVATLRQRHPDNRLVTHLGENCALRYGCANAKNLFLGRWECPVPLAPSCNAACVGCISAQPDAPIPSPQDRLAFVPEVAEVLEFALPHLESAPRAMLSFGQGCEGEPLLQAERIEEVIRAIRAQTPRGTLHLNTNGSRPDAVARLCDAGLDSIRVSTNTARAKPYRLYYRPLTYAFRDVVKTLRVAKERGCFTSINYLAFPGFTDAVEEVDALEGLIAATKLDMIQWRNLNLDPEVYVELLGLKPGAERLGMRPLLARLERRFPKLRHGYVNPPRERFRRKARSGR